MNICFFKFLIIWLILLFDMCLWLGETSPVVLQITLGHEIGAGAACLKCKDKCEGFDLHFWRFVLASFLHICAMLSFMHVVFIVKKLSNHVGHHWFDFSFLSIIIILSNSPTCNTVSIWQKAVTLRELWPLAALCWFPEVRTTGAKMPVPELYHCSGGACHSQSLSWGFRNSWNEKDINVDTGHWMQSQRLHLCVCFYAAGKGN